MKIFIILFMCVVSSMGYTKTLRPGVRFAEPETQEILSAIKECIADTGISTDAVILIRAGTYSEERLFQEFVHCAYKKSGYTTDDGHVLVDKAFSIFPKNVDVKEVVYNCGKEDGKDIVETTFNYFKCFQDTSPVRLQLS